MISANPQFTCLSRGAVSALLRRPWHSRPAWGQTDDISWGTELQHTGAEQRESK